MLIYDMVEPQELLGFVRTLAYPDLSLDNILTNERIPDIEFRLNRPNANDPLALDEDAATYRAFDAEAPIMGRGGVLNAGQATVRGQIPPISRKMRLGEEERLRMDALRTGDRRAIIDQIFNDTARLNRSVQVRLELARGQALYDGKVTIAENGIAGEVDFGLPAGNRVVTPKSWLDPTALVIDDALGWKQYYTDLNGEPFGEMRTSTAIISALLRNDQIKALAGGLTATPNIVTPATVAAVFQAYELPVPQAYDTILKVNGVAQRVIPDNRLIVLPRNPSRVGRTLYGITAEALELQSEGKIVAREAPGLVSVVEKTFDPVATWTKVAGIALPVVESPTLLMTVRVAP